MLARVIEAALTRRLLVLVLTALVAIGGMLAYRSLPIDAFPDVSTTQVKVIIKAPGMTPEEVEARITTPIELEMLGLPQKRIVRSVSKYAIADITIDFDDKADIFWARQQVAERLAGIMRELPENATGGLAPITTPLGEMFMFTVEGDLPLTERRGLLDWVIRPALRTLPGVADVNTLGGLVRTFEVVPDVIAMNARAVSMAMLQTALAANNRNDGAGRLTAGEEALLVRAEGRVRSLDDLGAVVVAAHEGAPVRVRDIAQVRIGSLTRYGTVTQDGLAETVQGLVLGLRGANARMVVESVRAKLQELAPALPPGVRTEVFYDRGALVERAVGTVTRALAEAIVLVLILLVLFLGSLRAAVVVAAILPLAALTTFMLMQAFGMSANLMSLGGLAIAIGMLVDAAVVVVENVMTRGAGGFGTSTTALPLLHVIYRSVREVATPVVSGIAIIVTVFLPLLTLEGLEGKLFIPVALTIVFALSGSLVFSITVIPVLASFLLTRIHHTEPWLVRTVTRVYVPLLHAALRRDRIVAAVAVVALIATAGAYSMIGKTFIPTLDEGDLIMQLEKLPSISLEQTAQLDMQVQRAVLNRVPEVKRIVARAGADEIGLDPMGLNQTDSFLVLSPRDQWRNPDKAWLTDELRKVMADFPGMATTFTQPIDMRVAEMLTGTRGDVAIKVFGPDLNVLNRIAGEIVAALSAVPGAEDVFSLKNEGVQYFRVDIDRLAVGRFGASVDEIAGALRSALEGQQVGIVLEGGRRTPVLLRGDELLRASPALFARLALTLSEGRSVPINAVARLERVDGPVKVDHENGTRLVLVQSNVRDRDLVGFVADARNAVAERVTLPAGYSIAWGGQFENQQRAAQRLLIVVPVALALIFMLLFATFGSVRQALLVYANVPFALIGGVFALWGSGEYLSVPASVGFIALLGIAVLNGVVLVTHFNELAASGREIDRVVVEGATRRLRPVLMTATIAAFGLVPLLFATGPGSEIQKPLAIVVVGGLVSSTLLTLFLLPILYRWFGASGVSRYTFMTGSGR